MTDLERFRAAVTAEPETARALASLFDPTIFEHAAHALAAVREIALSPEALQRRAPPIDSERLPPPGWYPVSLDSGGVRWLHFGGEPIAGAFFDDDCRRAAALPFNRLFAWRTPRAALASMPRRDPDCLIFHLSRCGSTLVAQMLAAPEGDVAVSEPAPIDAVVQHPLLSDAERIAALRGLAAAYAREARRCFLKLDSWHVRALPLFRAAFPDTPWVFLHREPVEVIVSHLRMRGRHTVPGLVAPESLGMPPDETGVPVADYIARVLALIAEGALAHWHVGGGLTVAYRDLPNAVFDRILPHLGVVPTSSERDAMAAAGVRDAKGAGTFQPDGDAKRAEAGAEVHAAAARLGPLHDALLRLGSPT